MGLIQRMEAIKCLQLLLTKMTDRKIKQWIVNNVKNMQFINVILQIFLNKIYENVEPFDFDFVKYYKNVSHIILLRCAENLNEKMIEKCRREFGFDNFTEYRKNTIWKLKHMTVWNLRKFKEMSIKCGNQLCETKSYATHKYGMKCSDFTTGKKLTKIVNKWHVCKGCQCVYYCSRKCQKIAWNKQRHKAFCTKL